MCDKSLAIRQKMGVKRGELVKIVFNGQEVVLQQGTMITGRNRLSEETGIKPSTIYKKLVLFKKLGFCNIFKELEADPVPGKLSDNAGSNRTGILTGILDESVNVLELTLFQNGDHLRI